MANPIIDFLPWIRYNIIMYIYALPAYNKAVIIFPEGKNVRSK